METLNYFINRINIQQYRTIKLVLENNMDLELPDLWTRIEPIANLVGVENFNDLLIISRGRDFEKYELELIKNWERSIKLINGSVSIVGEIKDLMELKSDAQKHIDNIYLHVLQNKPLYE